MPRRNAMKGVRETDVTIRKESLLPEGAQPPPIPISEEELREAGHKLARLVADRTAMKADHKADREAMRADMQELEAEIAALASTIRAQGR